MTSEETAGRRLDEQPQQPVRLPRLGVWASGGLSFLMAASLVVVSPVGLFVAPLALVPVAQWVVVDSRQGMTVWGWVVAALAVLSITGKTFLGTPLWAYLAVYILVVALPAASLETWRSAGWTEGRWIASTTLVGTMGTLAAVGAAAWPKAPLQALTDWFHETAVFVEESYRAVGISTGELELAFDAVASLVPWITPSLAAGYLVVVLFWIRPRLPILGFQMPVAAFESYRNDEWLPVGFAVGGLGTIFLSGTPRWAAVNLLIAVLMLYFVQGLAMIRAHLARWLGRGWLVRWGVALLCLQGPLPLVVAALGIADGFFELRPRTGDDGGNQ
jgi:hypothetical protein